MISSFKRVFVLAPHTDDGELGAGASICKMIEAGSEVYYFAFSTAEKSVPKNFPSDILKSEVYSATGCLGIQPQNVFVYDYEVRKLNYSRQMILEDLIAKRNEISPDLVLLPSSSDIHQDHDTVAMEGVRAFKNTTILGYELIWNNLDFRGSCFVEIDERHLQKKIHSLQEYRSQIGKQYMSEDFVRSLARTRGVQTGREYAECFEVVRWFI